MIRISTIIQQMNLYAIHMKIFSYSYFDITEEQKGDVRNGQDLSIFLMNSLNSQKMRINGLP